MSHVHAYHQIIAGWLCSSNSISVSEAGRGGGTGPFIRKTKASQNPLWSDWSYPSGWTLVWEISSSLLERILQSKDTDRHMLWLNKLRIQAATIEEVNVNLIWGYATKRNLDQLVWWHIPLIPVLQGQRQVDLYEFKVILVYKSANGSLLKSCSSPVKGGR